MREKIDLAATDSLPHCPQVLGLGLAEARSPKLCLDLPGEWPGAKCLGCHCCPPGGSLAGSWMGRGGAGIEPAAVMWLAEAPGRRPTTLSIVVRQLKPRTAVGNTVVSLAEGGPAFSFAGRWLLMACCSPASPGPCPGTGCGALCQGARLASFIFPGFQSV